MPIKITYQIAHACGTDAANRHMRKHDRTKWNSDDYDVAVATFYELMGTDPIDQDDRPVIGLELRRRSPRARYYPGAEGERHTT